LTAAVQRSNSADHWESGSTHAPAEVVPEHGWGELTLWETRPTAGTRWTDNREVHDRRGLKHRAHRDTRIVPIPPALVAIVREHIARFGVAPDGRLFRSPAGGLVGSPTYARVWDLARRLAFTPLRLPLHSQAGRTTCGTRLCRPGSTRVSLQRRSPNVRDTQ
jgi:hypothetical protein